MLLWPEKLDKYADLERWLELADRGRSFDWLIF